MARKKWKKKERIERKEVVVEGKKEVNKGFVLIGIVLVLVAGYYIFGQPAAPEGVQTPPPHTIAGEYTLVSDVPSAHVPGKVTLVEFFDFYCIHCYRFHIDRWPALKEKYGDSIELVDYGYPLRQDRIPPIEAYEIAIELGKGEEMKDAMFSAIHEAKRDISTIEALTTIAGNVGLDEEVFADALSSNAKSSAVTENIRLGNSYKLDSTPTIILDGNIKTTDSSIANLEIIIDSILEGE